jgi:hypothetical protein
MTRTRRIALIASIVAAAALGLTGLAAASDWNGHDWEHDGDGHPSRHHDEPGLVHEPQVLYQFP